MSWLSSAFKQLIVAYTGHSDQTAENILECAERKEAKRVERRRDGKRESRREDWNYGFLRKRRLEGWDEEQFRFGKSVEGAAQPTIVEREERAIETEQEHHQATIPEASQNENLSSLALPESNNPQGILQAETVQRTANTLDAKIENKLSRYQKRLDYLKNIGIKSLAKSVDPQDFSCPICLNNMVCPQITNCGHIFCDQCISEYLLLAKKCPICRTQIKRKRTHPLPGFEGIVRLISEEEEYPSRVEKYNAWLQSTRVFEVNVGDVIDVRDTLYVWCVGEVKQILKEGEMTVLLIHYKRWSSIYDEFIPLGSIRLAPAGVYTDRPDLPRYRDRNRNSQTLFQNAFLNFRLQAFQYHFLELE